MSQRFYMNLQDWHREGRFMPGYIYGFGTAYIAYLLGLHPVPRGPADYNAHGELLECVNKQHPRVVEMLEGPHGWTILQMLIARKAETLTDKENSHGRTQSAS